ncbi:hypothetical protein BCR33DRAFT_719376 [Rhizoclosmatium globosum]|uniref:Uncharacterized protein n=1 Tax=Rhizoclosmatium globosum TaxID=329046 RepID=A0A1Y2C0H4_9FUNG|nr:hypothetical protein BCR33DRAFT_719376 [Rhizoclosmatium globosum]|eukprot:ORY40377.1 hypothetical protein BCR33DRAFT_719376 [Rhizoclosmatium globosum]
MNIADLILPNFESDSESDGTDAITSILTKVEGLCSKLHDSRHHTSILFSSQEGTLVRARQEGVDDGL